MLKKLKLAMLCAILAISGLWGMGEKPQPPYVLSVLKNTTMYAPKEVQFVWNAVANANAEIFKLQPVKVIMYDAHQLDPSAISKIKSVAFYSEESRTFFFNIRAENGLESQNVVYAIGYFVGAQRFISQGQNPLEKSKGLERLGEQTAQVWSDRFSDYKFPKNTMSYEQWFEKYGQDDILKSGTNFARDAHPTLILARYP